MKWRAKEKGVYGFLIVEGKMIYFVGASQMEFGFLNSRFKSLKSRSLRKLHRYSITTEIQPPPKFLVSVVSPSSKVAVEGCVVFLEVSLVAFHLFIALVNKFDFLLPVSGQGSGRRWTLEKDLSQLKEHGKGSFDDHEDYGMKESWFKLDYGMKESWFKLVSISYLPNPKDFSYSGPYYVSENGEVLLMFEFDLILYDPRDNSFKYPRIESEKGWFDAEVYVETLVSPMKH
ncbi:hypothetical protein DEO72_LG3g667 [Vigna unguiculata]|uniref:F-box associated domain-containing protein n=1 Tax=Vigna unguiculata TaxID=3917 RepID=A0A4D6LCM3_VIGUN|nr:hypothetical protein DEO72_LG3g667 [Vigna unguiculata]